MKVKLKNRYAGPQGNFPADSEHSFDEKHAMALVDSGQAEVIDIEVEEPEPKKPKAKKPIERAVIKKKETAVMPETKD